MKRIHVALACTAALLAPLPARAAASYELVSSNPAGWGWQPYVSATGRYVVWTPSPGKADMDDGWSQQVWLRDRTRKVSELVSVTPGGAPSSGGNSMARPEVTADGRYVVFDSAASDLVAGDTNGKSDVFLRDRLTRRTRRISVGPRGAEARSDSSRPHVSADGRTIAFTSCADLTGTAPKGDGCSKLYVLYRGALRFVTDKAEATFNMISVNGNGSYVAFVSNASLAKDDAQTSNCRDDVYLYDVVHAKIVSMTHDQAAPGHVDCLVERDSFAWPQVDPAGKAVYFARYDDADGERSFTVLRRDIASGALTTVAALTTGSWVGGFAVSGDGKRVTYTGTTDGTAAGTSVLSTAVYLFDKGTSTRVSPAASLSDPCRGAGAAGNVPACVDSAAQPAMSADGKVIAFVTNVAVAENDTATGRDVYVRAG